MRPFIIYTMPREALKIYTKKIQKSIYKALKASYNESILSDKQNEFAPRAKNPFTYV